MESFLKKNPFFVIILLTIQNMKKFQYFKKSNSTKTLIRGKQASVLCTISGGQDSVLTFFMLLHAHSKESLHIFYCQHFWQIKNFFAARFLFQMSYLLKVRYTLILPQTNLLTENDSRQWRKKNYWRVSQIEQILTCVTGHTETDTLEKNLNNIFRGTSPASLSYCSFLIFENKTGTFFSNININTSSVSEILQSNKVFHQLKFANCQNKKKSFEKIKTTQTTFFTKNLVNKQDSVGATKLLSNSRSSRDSKYTRQPFFQFCKQKKLFFNQFHFSSNKSTDKENCKGINIPIKNFYFSQKTLNKFKTNTEIYQKQKKAFVSRNSSSFCFSSSFSTLNRVFKKPLQKTTRFAISKLLYLYKFPNIIDVTNFSFYFSRNKIRHQLLPFLRCLVQPKVESVVTQFFYILNHENQERENELAEVFFLCKLVNLKSRKKSLICLHPTATKSLFLIPFVIDPFFLPFQTTKTSETIREFEKLIISYFCQNLIEINKDFIKTIIKSISIATTGSLSQKFFFEYRNLNLKYSQIVKLQSFY